MSARGRTTVRRTIVNVVVAASVNKAAPANKLTNKLWHSNWRLSLRSPLTNVFWSEISASAIADEARSLGRTCFLKSFKAPEALSSATADATAASWSRTIAWLRKYAVRRLPASNAGLWARAFNSLRISPDRLVNLRLMIASSSAFFSIKRLSASRWSERLRERASIRPICTLSLCSNLARAEESRTLVPKFTSPNSATRPNIRRTGTISRATMLRGQIISKLLTIWLCG